MAKIFKGRVIIRGRVSGSAVVSLEGVNPLASWKDACLKKKRPALCSDQNNKELYNKQLDDKILCLPQFIGSTSGGLVLQTAMTLGLGPRGMLFSKHIDSLAASGIVLSDVWLNQQIIAIDKLGDEFLSYVKDEMPIEIKDDGTVIVG